MRALHLFDFYLPSTLSAVVQPLDHLKGVQIEVGSPWIVRNQFYNPGYLYHEFPLQQRLFPNLTSEFQHPHWKRLFIASQRYLPTYPAWLYQQLKYDPPDVLHAHFGQIGCLYLPLAKKLRRPLVVTFYGVDYTKLPRRHPVFLQKYQQLFREAACVIASSEVGCGLLEDMGCPAEKLAVVPFCPRLEQFPMQQRQKPAGQLRLVQVSTFTPKKGHLTTLEAFRLALADCPNLHLTLAGEQPDKHLAQQVRQFIETYHLGDHITWLDFIDHRQMADFLRPFDAFIHPSCHAPDGDHEDTPVVLIEAQATGLPVLATTHFNIPAQVLHDQTGLLAPENDALALADYIRRFYWMQNAEYQFFSKNARQHVETHFDVNNSAAKLGMVYKRVVSC